ncbi:MAG: hypothetical protein M3083_10285 [Actinomycetota bacterium]|nr:hypothetical protein [Actinomycetota bacterium]
MATTTPNSHNSKTSKAGGAAQVVERRTLRVALPLIDKSLEVPRELVPYYLGVGFMAACELIEWPVALIIAAGHTIAARSQNDTLRELGSGVEAGA